MCDFFLNAAFEYAFWGVSHRDAERPRPFDDKNAPGRPAIRDLRKIAITRTLAIPR